MAMLRVSEGPGEARLKASGVPGVATADPRVW